SDTAPFGDKILGFTIFSGYYLVFFLIINYDFARYDLTRFFQVTICVVIFQLAVSIAQKLGIFSIDLPFLPLLLTYDENIGSLSVSRVAGTFGDFELMAEYSAFIFIILTCLLLYKSVNKIVSYKFLIATIFSLLILVLLTGTRSSLMLIGVAFGILFITHLRILFSYRLWLTIVIAYFSFSFMVKHGDPLGLQLVFDRIAEIDLSGKGNQTSDEVINRDLTFQFAYDRIEEESWIIGKGYTTGEGYRKSLFGTQTQTAEIRDYHSLYLSMPIFFGWIGSFILILLFFGSLFFYANNMLRASKGSFAFYFSLGLLLSWLMLFVNEYKIQFIRYPNYFFLIWFWIAISINLSQKFSNEDHYSR
ncbi:MAG: O-antigen ligase domain-containing protein, partial [Flavobacterium sp.]